MTVRQPYALGVNEAELHRLGFQHRLWAESATSIWLRAGLQRAMTVLDVGCGPGFTTADLALLVGQSGRIAAIDEAEMFIAHLRDRARAMLLANVTPIVADATAPDEPLREAGFPPASFDFAYTRWVPCFVSDPEALVASVSRALRPGGVFAIQDYSDYQAIDLFPRSSVMPEVIAAVAKHWATRGGDCDVASRITDMLLRHGFEIREVRPLRRVASPRDLLWKWPEVFFENYLPVLVDAGLISQDVAQRFRDDWAARSADPNARFLTPPMLDIIGVRQ